MENLKAYAGALSTVILLAVASYAAAATLYSGYHSQTSFAGFEQKVQKGKICVINKAWIWSGDQTVFDGSAGPTDRISNQSSVYIFVEREDCGGDLLDILLFISPLNTAGNARTDLYGSEPFAQNAELVFAGQMVDVYSSQKYNVNARVSWLPGNTQVFTASAPWWNYTDVYDEAAAVASLSVSRMGQILNNAPSTPGSGYNDDSNFLSY